MVVTVPEGISKPYSDNDGVFWVKSGADKRRVTSREEVQRMLQSADLVHADEVPVEGTTAGDIDLEHFSGFFEKQYGESLDTALEKDGISLGQLLNNLGLGTGCDAQTCWTSDLRSPPSAVSSRLRRQGSLLCWQ